MEPANLVLDTTPISLNYLFPDKIDAKVVFSKYGQNPWGPVGSSGLDTGTRFLGLSFSEGDSVGGFTSVCDPTPFDLGCAYFGAKASFSGSGKAGIEYGLKLDGGALDIRYPVSISLDLPYAADGSGAPKIGEPFTIGSSWSVGNFKVLSKPGTQPAPLDPMLASHGPGLEAFVDLVGQASATVKGELCVGGCLPKSVGFNFDESPEVAALNRNGDGQIRAFGQPVSGQGELSGGIIQYDLKIPTLDAKGGLLPDKTLAASTQDKAIGLGLGIDEIVSALIGAPLSDSFGFNFAGKHIGVGYNLVEADAWLNMLLAQKLGFAGAPVVELEFSSPVQMLENGLWVDKGKTIAFNAGESVTLRAPGAQLLGVVPTYGLFGAASNDLDLKLEGELSVSALGLTSTIGDFGPLYSDKLSLGIGSLGIANENFAVNFEEVVGGAFNMAFLPWETYQTGTQYGALTFWDQGQWTPPPGSPCVGLVECSALAQSKVMGFFDLSRIRLPDCLADPDGCSESVLAELMRQLLALGPLEGRYLASGQRLNEEGGLDVFLNDLIGLEELVLAVQPDITQGEIDAANAALVARFGPQPFVVPPAPVPEPGTLALVATALAALHWRRRAGTVLLASRHRRQV
ncbi:MAG: PEP-CTERM sorting domain-containing protein [Burkholderiales bacterium]|nr:PEP-CTERM sorting domain-containing protein [Burkholderiales bacterium]